MIVLNDLSKTFRTADGQVDALKHISLTIPDGDVFGIIGMSGAGKSTLVRCINMLERPTEGTVEIDGQDLGQLSQAQLRQVRRSVTMIFQGFNLLMQRNCLSNVTFPLRLTGAPRAERNQRAMELLELVGLADKAGAYPAQLSGGQQQRVAIARALATNPKILLCDEATSALDPNTTHSILELIRDINQKLGITVVVITHQMNVVESICKHVAVLERGRVVEQGEVSQVLSRPQSAAAKRLFFPERAGLPAQESQTGQNLIQVVFNGAQAAGTPLIARLAIETGIEANITYASTRSIGGKAYGSMLLSVADRASLPAAISFLSQTPDVLAEEVTDHAD